MQFRFGDHSLDTERRELRRGGALVALEPQVFDLLVYLVQNRDRVVSKDDLLQSVWGGRIVSESALTSRITAVRKAIGDDGRAQRLIRTVPRKGLRFIGEVREEEQPPKLIDAERPTLGAPRSPDPLGGNEAKSAPRLSIVVLPFENLSNDPEQQYFADGITDDLTTDLSRISGSFVIARSTASTFKDKPVDVRRIGHDLGVRYVLEGSVRRTGDQVRVNVQLIDAISGAHLWADRFDTERANLAEAQDEITGRLARTLNFALVEDVSRRIDREKIIDPDARDLVMRGWACLIRSSSSEARQEAQRTLERALVLDPQSVDAKVYLAITLVINLLDGWSGSPLQDQARAEQLLLEVLEHDSNLAKAHFAMGMLRRIQGVLTEAQIELERAVALDRNYANAAYQLGLVLQFRGQPEAAIPYVEKAIRLSPHDPNSGVFLAVLGACHLLLGHVDQATYLLRRARAGNPRYWYIHFWLAGALGFQGNLDEAGVALARAIELKPEIRSQAQYRAQHPWEMDPAYLALRAKTLDVGLRRAGFSDE